MTVRPHLSARWALGLLTGMCATIAACDDSTTASGTSLPTGSIELRPGQIDPDPNRNQLRFIVADNRGGNASNLRVTAVTWGRMVDIYAPLSVGGTPVKVFDDYLIGSDIESDGQDFLLERQHATGGETLTMLDPFDTSAGSPFMQAFGLLDDNLQQVIDKSLDPSELPPFTAVARNGTLALTFDDLVDETTITENTVKLQIGYPPQQLQVARIVPDTNYGDLVNGVFHSARVLIDFTITPAEAQANNAPVNSVGLPESQNTAQANVAVRLPTRTAAGVQFEILRNLSGRSVSFTGNGSTDPFAASLDVVRAFRSGGRTAVTQDPFNGFLRDNILPQLLSSQSVTVTPTFQNGVTILADVTFGSAPCAVAPRIGDVLAFNTGLYGRVLSNAAPPTGGVAQNVSFEVIDPPAGFGTLPVSQAEFRTPWERIADQIQRPECWVHVQPPPTSGVGTGISTTSTFSLQFSEPMDPSRLSAFDTFQLLYGFTTPALQGQVVAGTAISGDLTRFTLQPAQRLRHTSGSQETYRVALPPLALGPVDLAGNPLQFPLTDSNGNLPDFTVRSADASIESRSLMLKFSAPDEDPLSSPVGNELRGQLIYDLLNGRVRPRSVTRISAICDLNTPIIQTDTAGAAAATRLPFVPQGCRLMTLWRHADLGFDLMGDGTHNLDVEGLNWTPVNSGLQIDTFPLFQMGVAHSFRLPDEALDPMTGAPLHPNSSISDTFADNLLDPANDPLLVVHPKTEGYFLQPSDVFTSATGTQMAPWPMNQDKPLSEYVYYTWRDTALLALGQPNLGTGSGQGVKLGNELLYDTVPPNQPYALAQVPTIGLPLLMDFRVYPSSQIIGANRLLGFFAIASVPPGTEVPPFWTAYTSGGIPASTGIPVTIDPDQQFVAAGGIPGGVPGNLSRNQFIFFGQGDFVVRVNRAHTRWFECAPSAPGSPFTFAEPVVEPAVTALPPGTQVLIQYRGATGMNSAGNKPWEDAAQVDPYGNAMPGGTTYTITFLNGDRTWKNSMAEINGSQYFQARITLVSNVESGATPELSSLGFAFSR